MKQNKKLFIVFSILIVIFAASIVNKTFQNDTFFTIPIGNYILKNGIISEEQFAYHEGLEFTNSRWAFDLIIACIYNVSGFGGVYVFTIIMTSLIGLVLFYVLIKRKNNIILSLLTTLTALYFSRDGLCARGQIISYLMFIIEIYLIETLLETQKKRYCVGLIIVSIIIANFHASVWPMYFVFFMPYIAEYIFAKIWFCKYEEKIFTEKFGIKLLLITFIIADFSGLCTPIGLAPYTDMLNVMSGVSTSFISELTPVALVENEAMFISLIMYILMIGFKRSKIKFSDFCMVVGLFLMAMLAYRNTIFFYLIGAISFARIVTSIIDGFDDVEKFTQMFAEKNSVLTVFCLIVVGISVVNYLPIMLQEYVDEEKYPVQATEYILENIDIDEMRIFNHFNFGAYLEFKGVPVFIDSRSGIYCAEFNDTTILEDWLNVYKGKVHYKEIFEKYRITHVLFYKNEIANTYISIDSDYEVLYEDDNFILYEKIGATN